MHWIPYWRLHRILYLYVMECNKNKNLGYGHSGIPIWVRFKAQYSFFDCMYLEILYLNSKHKAFGEAIRYIQIFRWLKINSKGCYNMWISRIPDTFLMLAFPYVISGRKIIKRSNLNHRLNLLNHYFMYSVWHLVNLREIFRFTFLCK